MRSSARIQENVVMQLDPESGQVMRAWGGGGRLSLPHMITVDHQGNVFVVDVGRHQVIKFSPSGEVLLTLGTEMVPGRSAEHFCKPTQVAAALDGTIFVADGYCNNRVAKFSANGRYLGEGAVPIIGASAGAPVVHSVLLNECRNLVLVAAREVGKVHALDAHSLALKETYDLSKYGKVWSLAMGPYGRMLALTWQQGKDAQLVEFSSSMQAAHAWAIPGLRQSFPHDIGITAAPSAFTGAAERAFALIVAPSCASGCGPLHRYLLGPPEVLRDISVNDVSLQRHDVSVQSSLQASERQQPLDGRSWNHAAFVLSAAGILGAGVIGAAWFINLRTYSALRTGTGSPSQQL